MAHIEFKNKKAVTELIYNTVQVLQTCVNERVAFTVIALPVPCEAGDHPDIVLAFNLQDRDALPNVLNHVKTSLEQHLKKLKEMH